MKTVLNFCFCDYAAVNLAENFSQPVDYFFPGAAVRKLPISIESAEHIDFNVDLIIIGGGGIFTGGGVTLWDKMKQIVSAAPLTVPIVVWGMGINDHGRADRLYDETLHWLASRPNVIVGLRDAFHDPWVPCASCMRPEFDHASSVTHDVVYYSHCDLILPLPFPRLTNRVQGDSNEDLAAVVAFMTSAETVVTNTYHGAYWATLLNRRVIVIKPFSNKFSGFRHEPIITTETRQLSRLLKRAVRYPHALAECRHANMKFLARVREHVAAVASGAAEAPSSYAD